MRRPDSGCSAPLPRLQEPMQGTRRTAICAHSPPSGGSTKLGHRSGAETSPAVNRPSYSFLQPGIHDAVDGTAGGSLVFAARLVWMARFERAKEHHVRITNNSPCRGPVTLPHRLLVEDAGILGRLFLL